MSFTIDHLHLKSADPERMAAFFVDSLGATQSGTTIREGLKRISLELDGMPIMIDETATALPPPSGLGYNHIALGVSGHDAVMAALRTKGVTVTVEPYSPRPGIKAAFISGPEGLLIEILDRNAQ